MSVFSLIRRLNRSLWLVDIFDVDKGGRHGLFSVFVLWAGLSSICLTSLIMLNIFYLKCQATKLLFFIPDKNDSALIVSEF